MITFKKVTSSRELPPEWDICCTSYFQMCEFLNHCQEYNPCKQRYYLLFNNEQLVAGAVVYSLRLDLFTFLNIPSPVTMNICGIPCSVSSNGTIGDSQFTAPLAQQMLREEKGLLLFLNSETIYQSCGVAHGRTWPTIILEHSFKNWGAYVDGMRSEYRRRIKKIEKFCEDVSFSAKPLSDFSDRHHQYYHNVYKKSTGKLELLKREFFRNLPENFHLTEVYYKDIMAGWTITNFHRNTCSFFLGGQDYSIHPGSIYLAKLYNIIKTAINNGYHHIELGQSAEIPKIRFGGRISEKYMAAYHSNRLINRMIHSSANLLSYKKNFNNAAVFSRSSF